MIDDLPELFRPHRYKVLYGGRGSGKSWAFARMLVALCNMAKLRAVCLREVQNSIKDSSYQLICDVIESFGLQDKFHVTREAIEHENGSYIIFKGLRNAQNIKSLEGYDIAWVEEAQTVSEDSWKTLIPTIRKPDSEIWISFNPLSPDDPTYLRFVVNPQESAYVRKINYDENPYCPQTLLDEAEYMRRVDPEAFQHVWLGEPLTVSNAQIFRGKYVVETFPDDLYLKSDRLFFGADFGYARDPNTLVRCFMLDRKLYVDFEAYGVGVDLDEMDQLYRSVPESEKWEIIGDCARPETIAYLHKRFGFQMTPSPKWQGSIEDGIAFLRSFEQIVIHSRCKHTADEFRLYSYKVDKVTEKVLPVIVDANNHCIAEGELVTTARGDIPIEDVVAGDFVLTRSGYREVIASEQTGSNREVLSVSTGYSSIMCTAEHRVFTTNRGFVEARFLTAEDTLLCLESNQSNGADTNGTDTQIQKEGLTGFISSDQLPEGRFGSIEKFGEPLTGKSQKVATSTTLMETRLTTESRILSALPRKFISEKNTNIQKKGLLTSENTLTKFETSLVNGTALSMDLNGTRNMQGSTTSGSLIFRKETATDAGSSSSQKHITTGFARTLANLHGEGLPESTMSKKPVNGAESRLSPTNTQKFVFVARRVQCVTQAGNARRVFDLTVDENPEFFVNGILVHNCIDALRYALADYIKHKDISQWFKLAPSL